MSPCVELDGSERYHVGRFQMIAPMSAAKTTSSEMWEESTIPLAILVATLRETHAPTTLRTAESPTATRGRGRDIR